jgi:hypothetical protein
MRSFDSLCFLITRHFRHLGYFLCSSSLSRSFLLGCLRWNEQCKLWIYMFIGCADWLGRCSCDRIFKWANDKMNLAVSWHASITCSWHAPIMQTCLDMFGFSRVSDHVPGISTVSMRHMTNWSIPIACMRWERDLGLLGHVWNADIPGHVCRLAWGMFGISSLCVLISWV